jgi:hypothetical protein
MGNGWHIRHIKEIDEIDEHLVDLMAADHGKSHGNTMIFMF